ncbi:DNA damage-regulated autophagy modulator protein 1 isoform X3 [Callithrix jacchus]
MQSDKGIIPLESAIFTFMFNISAFLAAATIYTRYKIVEKKNRTYCFSSPALNLVSFFLGLLGCIGMSIVASFQGLNVTVVHDAGALLAFVCGSIYTLLQSIIFYESCPQWNSLWMCHIRMIISAVCCAAVVLMIVCASLVSTTKLEWDPSEKAGLQLLSSSDPPASAFQSANNTSVRHCTWLTLVKLVCGTEKSGDIKYTHTHTHR